MRSLTIELNEIPPSVNVIYRFNFKNIMYMTPRGHRFIDRAKAKAIDAVEEAGWDIVKAGKFIEMKVWFEFRNKRFPDPNNMLKILIDSFEGVVFENDKWVLPKVMNAKINGKMNKTKVVFSVDDYEFE